MTAASIALRSFLTYTWQGPSGLPSSLRFEWRFVAVRWLGILIVLPGLSLTHLSSSQLFQAYIVLGIAAVYNLLVQITMPRWSHVFVSGYITAIGDGLLNVLLVYVGGGFNSPFFYLLFTVTISTAIRYGYGPSLAMVLCAVGVDGIRGGVPVHSLDATYAFHSCSLLITALLASYLRGQMLQAETALQNRLRQANLLNEATLMLGASLEFETLHRAVAAAACHLLGGRLAVLRPLASMKGDEFYTANPLHYPGGLENDTAVYARLTQLCERYAVSRGVAQKHQAHFPEENLSSGERVIVLVLSIPARNKVLATLAVSLPQVRAFECLDTDVLETFVERIALAIENASLYDALARRSDDLQRAYRELAVAHQELLSVDEMKTSFLANVSHELRTPLTSIRSFSELLLAYDDDEAVQREFIQIINSESERLTRLVNDVLDISKIDSGKMDWNMTTVDAAALLRESARVYGPLIQERGLHLEFELSDDLPPVNADRDRLQQVISNLLNNAMKFTENGEISLRARREASEILISVTDTGIGISVEEQQRIFDKFHQVGDTLTKKPHGTGLGLSICREIISHHQGRIWVESEPSLGSTFTLALPTIDTNTPSFGVLTGKVPTFSHATNHEGVKVW